MSQLNFKGKQFVQNYHFAVPFHTLETVAGKSVFPKGGKPSLDDNLIIHGDNLKALKALLPKYAGQVKCIYIDPPYNTGNEKWAYNDNVNSPMMKEWLHKVVDSEDLTRHDKWLCMMMPRLKLLRELLREDGVIFISIDDNEQHHLRMLMDEVFGEENFVANIVWQKKYSPQSDSKYFSDMHDFLLVYAKKKNDGTETSGWIRNLISRTDEQNARYKNPDNDPRGPWKAADFSVKTYSEAYDYAVTTPSGRVVNPPNGRAWATSEKNFTEWVKDNRIWFGQEGKNVPAVKIFLSEVQDGTVPLSLWLREEVGDNEEARKEIKDIFTEADLPFNTPKPVRLIKRILQLATDKNSIILDSFAGSGTTAHAVLKLNKEDGGNRKFILVEMEEYADTITAERVRRVIKGIHNPLASQTRHSPFEKGEKRKEIAGLGGAFSYVELGGAIDTGDILSGKNLPSFIDMARYVFYTATGKNIDEKKIKEASGFVGETEEYDVYLLYKADLNYLKTTALDLEKAKQIAKGKSKKCRLVFAPAKYLDQEALDEFRIDFAQLPFGVYRR